MEAMSSNRLHSAPPLKSQILHLLSKLSDRDTCSLAASELAGIIAGISPSSIVTVLSTLHTTDLDSSKPVVRTHFVRLLTLLTLHHSQTLAPHVPKLISSVLRRSRDPDTSVRNACIEAITSISSRVTNLPFDTLLIPLSASLFTEQDPNAQICLSLSLSGAIESHSEPDPSQLKKLTPRLVKLLRSRSFKAKPGVLTLIGSIIGTGGAFGLGSLIPCLVEFLSSDEWAARKAASEALLKLGVKERDSLVEFKASCMKTFEARRYDKVKIVRNTMNRMVEVWREIPDILDKMSPPPRSQSSSKDKVNGEEGRFQSIDCETPQSKRMSLPITRNNAKPAMCRELADRARHSGSHEVKKSVEGVEIEKQERNKPANAVGESFTSNEIVDLHKSRRETEDLALIRKQLIQIENQQSSLLDLLQKFVGSSQNGMRSLETRVHGLERVLDGISFELAVSTRRMSSPDPTGAMCCKFPVSDFLNSKFRRRPHETHQKFSSLEENGRLVTNPLADSVEASNNARIATL